MAKSRFYLAYGSNLSVEQMLRRCPEAVYVGTAELENMCLRFRGSKTGSYLTVDPCDGESVPCLVWKVSKWDEMNLDYYEGYPKFYQKQEIVLPVHNLINGRRTCKVRAFFYRMSGTQPLGAPRGGYWHTCAEGYRRFGFDGKVLDKACYESCGQYGSRIFGRKIV